MDEDAIALRKAKIKALISQPHVKQQRREATQRWAAKYPERKKQSTKRWRQKNINRIREQDRAKAKIWVANNKELKRKRDSEYYLKHSVAVRNRSRQWRINNPDKVRILAVRKCHKRRARIANAVQDKFAGPTIERLKSVARMACYYCGVNVPPSKRHIDHITPLSKGGEHSSRNLCVACPDCNLTKQSKLLTEWAPVTGQKIFQL